MKTRPVTALLCLGVVSLLIAMAALLIAPAALTWRDWRQQKLDRALIAATRNDLPAAMRAMRQGADPNARDKTPVLSAWELFSRRITGKKPLAPQGEPPLSLLFFDLKTNTAPAAPGDRCPLVRALLARGANPSPANAQPALVCAAAQGDRRSLRALLAAGAGDHEPELCNSGLWQIIMEKDPQDVETLLNKGADVNFDPGRCNMLCYAVWSEDEATVKVLLRRGADPNVVCRRGVTALGMAREMKLARIERLLRQAGAKR